jgi:hypothetical protein
MMDKHIGLQGRLTSLQFLRQQHREELFIVVSCGWLVCHYIVAPDAYEG